LAPEDLGHEVAYTAELARIPVLKLPLASSAWSSNPARIFH
jgi:hypothetical protein